MSIPDCASCIHRDVCGLMAIPNDCNHYLDESLLIKSPCSIGTTVYIRRESKDHTHPWAQECTVIGLHLRDTESYRGLKKEEYLVVRSGIGFAKHIPFSHIGTKVFFNKEEAIQGCCSSKEDL